MKIENARIMSADLSMEDHGVLTLWLTLGGQGWACGFGGRVLGKGYVGAKEFKGSEKGIEEVMRIMDVVGVSKFSDINGKIVRVEMPDWGGTIDKIGNVIEDKWFSYKEFYERKEE